MMPQGWIQMNSRLQVRARVGLVAALASTHLVRHSGPSLLVVVLASKVNKATVTSMIYSRSLSSSSLWVVKAVRKHVDHRTKQARQKERTLMYFKLIRHTLLNI